MSTSQSFSQGVVTNEPTFSRPPETGTRRPIPVSVIDQNNTLTSHFTPLHGLDFLFDIFQLIIQQTVELPDCKTNILTQNDQNNKRLILARTASENRYTVKVPREETIFYATESSTSFHRTCFGSGRAFGLKLYDPTQQEAIEFRRRLACGSCCGAFFYLQELEVWIPPGQYIGKISQNFSLNKSKFSVHNREGTVLYIIEGADSFLGCVLNKNYNFKIYNSEGTTQIGSVVHQWDQIEVSYNLFLQMPRNERDNRNKALLLGASFLLEYMYFEQMRQKTCRCIC